MGNFIVYQSRAKQLGLAILGAIMVGVGAVLLYLGFRNPSAYYEFNPLSMKDDSFGVEFIIIGVICVLFFGMCEAYILKSLVVGKELVVLTPRGFYDRSSALAMKKLMIPWSEVVRIEKVQMQVSVRPQTFVTVGVRDTEGYLAQLPAWKRKAVQANLKLGFDVVAITLQSAKHCSYDQLVEKMRAYAQSASNSSAVNTVVQPASPIESGK